MQNRPPARGHSAGDYRERLSPSLWTLASAAVTGPMIALVFAPLDTTVALAVGGVVAVGIVALLVAASPTVAVQDGMLVAGRARIAVDQLGDPVGATGERARHLRGPGLDARAWHLIRGGIDGLVVVPVDDPDDPVTEWVISTRTPDRLGAAVRRAQLRRRTPRR